MTVEYHLVSTSLGIWLMRLTPILVGLKVFFLVRLDLPEESQDSFAFNNAVVM